MSSMNLPQKQGKSLEVHKVDYSIKSMKRFANRELRELPSANHTPACKNLF